MKYRTLLVSPECPWPADTGLRNHGIGMIRSLALLSDLSVIGYSADAEEAWRWGRLAQQEQFSLLATPRRASGFALRWNQVRCLLRRQPLSCSPFRVASARAAVTEAVSAARRANRAFDLLAYEMFWTGLNGPPDLGVRTMLFPVDGYGLYWRRMGKVCQGWTNRARCRYLAAAFDRMEKAEYRRIDIVATVAQPDAESIRRRYRGTTVVVPVPLARGIQAKGGSPSVGPTRILLGGFFKNEAIANDMKRFLSAWQPRRDADLVVWGRGAVGAGLEAPARRADARIVEWVENPQSMLDSAAVYVYPQRFTCGIQTKVQEAMAAGLCVIANRDTLDAVGARDGIEALQANGPEAAAKTLAGALDRGAHELPLLGAAARAHAAREFSVEAVALKLRGILGWAVEPG